jgi:HK97 family phage major capsid protein
VGTALDLDTLYAAQASLPPRYSPAARWLMNIADMNAASRLVASGDADEPQVFSADGSRLLRKPVDELSTLPAGHVVYGDIRAGFTIVDRIGMEIELVPHLMGPNRRPTGSRGLYAYWRNSSAVLNPEALRAIIPSS